MRQRLTPMKVGLMMLVGVLGFAWYIVQTSDSPITRGGGYRVSAVFDDAMGLVRKSRVLIAGIAVGEIENVELENGRARVHLRIRKDVVLHEDAAIRKIQESMLGTSLLEISPGTPGKAVLDDGSEIRRIIPTPGFNDMMIKLGFIAEDLRDVTASLKSIMENDDPTRGSVREMVDHLNGITRALDRSALDNVANLDRILQNTERLTANISGISGESRAEVRLILSQIRELTASLKGMVDRQGERLDGSLDQVDVVLAKLEKNFDQLQKTLDHSVSVAEKVDNGKGAVGTLINDEQVGQDIKDVASAAGDYARKLRDLRFLFHVQSDFYPRQISAKTAVSLKLMPSANKYYQLSVVDDPKGRTRKYRTITRSTDSSRDAYIREDKTVTSDSLKVSLLYAQRFHFATVRFGLIENSGGVGFDMEFFDDILKIRNDINELATGEVYPRLKSQINVEIWRHLFLSGGVDDIINDATRDYFVGAGIQFEDEDIRTLLGVGAGGAASAMAGQ